VSSLCSTVAVVCDVAAVSSGWLFPGCWRSCADRICACSSNNARRRLSALGRHVTNGAGPLPGCGWWAWLVAAEEHQAGDPGVLQGYMTRWRWKSTACSVVMASAAEVALAVNGAPCLSLGQAASVGVPSDTCPACAAAPCRAGSAV